MSLHCKRMADRSCSTTPQVYVGWRLDYQSKRRQKPSGIVCKHSRSDGLCSGRRSGNRGQAQSASELLAASCLGIPSQSIDPVIFGVFALHAYARSGSKQRPRLNPAVVRSQLHSGAAHEKVVLGRRHLIWLYSETIGWFKMEAKSSLSCGRNSNNSARSARERD